MATKKNTTKKATAPKSTALKPKSGFRIESDLLGEKYIPNNALYGVQTLRGMENFDVSGKYHGNFPHFISGFALTKWGAAEANYKMKLITKAQRDGIVYACKQLLEGKHYEHFPIDMMQGGAGTSVNMNANEVIANLALEYMGKNIRAARKSKNLTIETLSELAGISESFLGTVERGESSVSIETLINLCRVLNVSTDSLIFDSGKKPAPSNKMDTLLTLLKNASDSELDFLIDYVKLYRGRVNFGKDG